MAGSRQRLQTGSSVHSSKAARHLAGPGSLKLAQKNRHLKFPAKLPLEHKPAPVQRQPAMDAAGQMSPPPSRKVSPKLVLIIWCQTGGAKVFLVDARCLTAHLCSADARAAAF